MAETSPIEWVRDPATGRHGATWSHVTGCTDADPSCRFCYAKRLTATRLRTQPKYEGLARVKEDTGPVWSGEVRLHPELLTQPAEWVRPRQIFVCSMSDLFHEDVPEDFILDTFAMFSLVPQHRFWVLTKRIGRARKLLGRARSEVNGRSYDVMKRFSAAAAQRALELPYDHPPWPLRHVYVGTSAGRQQELEPRWADLMATPAYRRFLSLEPLIEPVDLVAAHRASPGAVRSVLPDLVITGGESGRRGRCRAPHPGWFQRVRDDCAIFEIAYHHKQNGNYREVPPEEGCQDDTVVFPDGQRLTFGEVMDGDVPGVLFRTLGDGRVKMMVEHGAAVMRYGSKKSAGRELDGVVHDGVMPEEDP